MVIHCDRAHLISSLSVIGQLLGVQFLFPLTIAKNESKKLLLWNSLLPYDLPFNYFFSSQKSNFIKLIAF